MESFVQKYFNRFDNNIIDFGQEPNEKLNISIVIPCYNEPNIKQTLQSLSQCKLPECFVEVIIVINSSKDDSESVLIQNKRSYETCRIFAENSVKSKLLFLVCNIDNLPPKDSGVGLARKIGMDESVLRFGKINNPGGIIVGLDADSIVEKNYLTEIEKYFIDNPNKNACSIHFEHPLSGNEFPENIYRNITSYELHLRYYINALRFTGFPFAFHTIGSSFAVKAETYAKQGGMNKRKAGEDFYFLQKVIPLGYYGEITGTKVIPSPRISERVPFGTGAAIRKMVNSESQFFETYNFEAFKDLKKLFDNYKIFFEKEIVMSEILLPALIQEFLSENNFFVDLRNIISNSPNIYIFRKRFFEWFNAFRVLKFLNFAHEKKYEKINSKEAGSILLKELKIIETSENSEKEILKIFIELDKMREVRRV